MEATKKTLAKSSQKRRLSPIDETPLEPWADLDGLEYFRCPKTGSLFLGEMASPEHWKILLEELAQYRYSKGFHKEIRQQRLENVYAPKIAWIENSLRLHGLKKAHLLEVTTPPSALTDLLKEKKFFEEVVNISEMDMALGNAKIKNADAVILLESLDRVTLPDQLLKNVYACLNPSGLLFVTALVSSGFDTMVLEKKNAYLYPPDRTNCFSLEGLKKILTRSGFRLVEVSTPGVLDVEVVQAHLAKGVSPSLSTFEQQLFRADSETILNFQKFLQQSSMSSFARIVAVKEER